MLLAAHMPKQDTASRRQPLPVVCTARRNVQSSSLYKCLIFLLSSFSFHLQLTVASVLPCSSPPESMSLFCEECLSNHYLGWQNATEIGSHRSSIPYTSFLVPANEFWALIKQINKQLQQNLQTQASVQQQQTKFHLIFSLRYPEPLMISAQSP